MIARHTIENADGLIEYIESAKQPLSADIGIIHGKDFTWLFDVGCGEAPLSAVGTLASAVEPGRGFRLVVSHFHPDHTGNLSTLFSGALTGSGIFPGFERIFVGANTFKYTGTGTITDSDIYIADGPEFHIFPLPSCHAKGSLGLEINREFVFVGDALCPTVKSGKTVYNAGLLRELTEVLKRIPARFVLISHRMDRIEEKAEVIGQLEKIYSRREKNNPYIPADMRSDFPG